MGKSTRINIKSQYLNETCPRVIKGLAALVDDGNVLKQQIRIRIVREYKRKRSEDQQEKYCIVPFAFIYLLILETLCMLNQRDVSNRRFV